MKCYFCLKGRGLNIFFVSPLKGNVCNRYVKNRPAILIKLNCLVEESTSLLSITWGGKLGTVEEKKREAIPPILFSWFPFNNKPFPVNLTFSVFIPLVPSRVAPIVWNNHFINHFNSLLSPWNLTMCVFPHLLLNA